jgi:hypothetical protein
MALIGTLVATSFFKSLWIKASIILIVTLLLKFSPGLDIDNIVFLVSALIGVTLAQSMPFKKEFNIFISIIISLSIFNAYIWLL